MNNKVAVRQCKEYKTEEVLKVVSEIWENCEGPDVSGRKVLLKPNILTDSDPGKAIVTNPIVVDAVIKLLKSKGAEVIVGDSPAVHLRGFRPDKSGIAEVCRNNGVEWVDFTKDTTEIKLRNGKIKVTSQALEADLIVSLPKLKNHELVYFTGAIKNSLGLVPGFTKAKQHALHHDRVPFAEFLVSLNEAVTPQFFIMDGITAMEGPGPGQGFPYKLGLLLGSTNPVALDIVATTVAGYNPLDIPTTSIALKRGKWLSSTDEIVYDGPELQSLVRKDFKRIPVSQIENIAFKFIKHRISFIKKLDRRPVFIHENCTGCMECIKICPANAITMHPEKENHVVLTDQKCIRCFCCSEVCQSSAVEVRRKIFGV
jgi:uncharacterized protein (DUF362 family)/Pyruvate/2-oxoacid:ferredoxin oxidoreductase delta subunit